MGLFHWNGNIVIWTAVLSVVAPKVVKKVNSGAASDKNIVKMKFLFQFVFNENVIHLLYSSICTHMYNLMPEWIACYSR